MGLYADVMVPMLYDRFMKAEPRERARTEYLKDVQGDILEIGFGTGLNLPHYPEHVCKITTIEKSWGMNKKAIKRTADSGIEVDQHVLNGEKLPFDDESFDTVVSAYCMCSIDDLPQALSEMKRVMRPDGKLFFLEHGLSEEHKVQKWQNRLNPLQKIWGAGCNMNRKMDDIIRAAGFEITSMERYVMEDDPKMLGSMYQGVAIKAA